MICPTSPNGDAVDQAEDIDFDDCAPVPVSAPQPQRIGNQSFTPPARLTRPVSAASPLARVMPHSIDAEEYFLGCAMLDGAEILTRHKLKPAAFYSPANRLVYERMVALNDNGCSVDLLTLSQELKQAGELDQIGGYPFLVQISARVPTTAQAEYFAEKLKELEGLRELIRQSTAIVEDCYSYQGGGISDLVGNRIRALQAIADGKDSSNAAALFEVWTPSQYIAYQEEKSALLLGDGILERAEWTSFGGVGGLGKTRLAIQLLICQMTGKPWCGLPTAGEPQRAIFLSTENGVRRYKADFERMLRSLTDDERKIVDANFFIPPLTAENDLDLCLGDSAVVARLQATIKHVNPGIVVFDPWADMVDGDENKTEDVRDTLRILRRVLQASAPTAAVLIIAHARTGSSNVLQAGDNYAAGNFMRGAKALFSKVRAEIQLAPGDKDNSNHLVLACGKSNNSAKFSTRGIIFDPETFTYSVDPSFDIDAWRSDVAGKRRNQSASVAEVVACVREKCGQPGLSIKAGEICKAVEETTGASIRTIKTRIAEAVSAGYLRKTEPKGSYALGSKPLPK